ncbi:nickel insertion protein [Roseovarius sp. S4756]|uniref:nickel insertion protein n=1 Tax=Roseovarius maritimus TaxID=3342637 RepID=UPI003729F26A
MRPLSEHGDCAQTDGARDQLVDLAFDIDDMTGEELAAAVDALRADPGVVDLMLLTGQGKKSRLVVRLELLVKPDQSERIAASCFDLTTTLGLRTARVDRLILTRTEETGPGGLRRKRAARPGGETVKVESDDLIQAETLATRRALAWWAESD